HPEFYQNTALKQTRASDHGDLDIVAAVLPAARKRGMKLLCSIEDVFRSDLPGVKEVAELDLQGRKTGTLCLFHPGVRAFWTGLAADLCTSYDIDGILFFNERNGPLLNALGASHAQSIASSRVTCFCEFHQKAASASGISFDRAREGYRKLDQFVQNALADKRPGYAHFIQNVGSTVFRDVPKDELLRFNNHLLNYENEAALDALPAAGLSPDYVARETKRALAGVQEKCTIYPGIDIGIPTGKNSRKASPDDTYAATFAALKAGAHGVMLSRKYSEMRLANLEAAGRAAREVLKQ